MVEMSTMVGSKRNGRAAQRLPQEQPVAGLCARALFWETYPSARQQTKRPSRLWEPGVRGTETGGSRISAGRDGRVGN